MQQQHMMAEGFSPSNIPTDHIQRYLDENKSLILKILGNQKSGKLSECAENQARLPCNLMDLAAISDCQPQPQLGAKNMQHQQSQQPIQQSLMAAQSPMLYALEQPCSALQQQQSLHTQLGNRSAVTSGLQTQQSDINIGGGGGTGPFHITSHGLQGAGKEPSSAGNQDSGRAGSAEG